MFKYTDTNGQIRPWKLGIHALLGLVVVMAVLSNLPFAIVEAGERGVVAKFGQVQDRVLGEGLHVINPFGTEVHKMDVKVQKEEIDASAASKDLQIVTSKIAVTYRLDENRLLEVFRSVRRDYSNRYIAPNIQEAVKAATAKYTAEELVTKREAVRDEIKSNFVQKLIGTGLIVDNISIIDFDFSVDFNKAIERKVTAEQDAKAAQNKLVQVQAEAQQSIERAKAEAENIRLQSSAANNDKYVQLKQLEVQQEFAKKWNGVLPQNLYGSAPIPFLQLGR
jgi:regulator of protease activity HflC (stomatin/prohibitin superfamily)